MARRFGACILPPITCSVSLEHPNYQLVPFRETPFLEIQLISLLKSKIMVLSRFTYLKWIWDRGVGVLKGQIIFLAAVLGLFLALSEHVS